MVQFARVAPMLFVSGLDGAAHGAHPGGRRRRMVFFLRLSPWRWHDGDAEAGPREGAPGGHHGEGSLGAPASCRGHAVAEEPCPGRGALAGGGRRDTRGRHAVRNEARHKQPAALSQTNRRRGGAGCLRAPAEEDEARRCSPRLSRLPSGWPGVSGSEWIGASNRPGAHFDRGAAESATSAGRPRHAADAAANAAGGVERRSSPAVTRMAEGATLQVVEVLPDRRCGENVAWRDSCRTPPRRAVAEQVSAVPAASSSRASTTSHGMLAAAAAGGGARPGCAPAAFASR